MLFDPSGLRPFVMNWEAVARAVLVRIERELASHRDHARRELLREILARADMPAAWREPNPLATSSLLIPFELRLGGDTLRLFSTITTLGTPQDITLQELRIESFHAADDATAALLRALATSSP
jgi:hypothetical protein